MIFRLACSHFTVWNGVYFKLDFKNLIISCSWYWRWNWPKSRSKRIKSHALNHEIVGLTADNFLTFVVKHWRCCSGNMFLSSQRVNCVFIPDVPCPALAAPNHGGLSPASCTTRQAALGTVCTASCDTGFTLNGHNKVTCLDNGQWSTYGSLLTCAGSHRNLINL